MTDLTIRKATTEEIPFLQQFSREVIDKNYREHLGDEAVDFFIGSGASDQYVTDNIEDTMVAVQDGQIVGMCVCKENLVDLLMVQSEFHRQGIGSAFLGMVGEMLFKDYAQLRLECFEKNKKANGFYLKNGWSQEKIRFDEELKDNRIYYIKQKESEEN